MRRHSNKEINKYLKELEKQGWTMATTKPGHFRLRSPKGYLLSLASSPTCPHALVRIKKDVARIISRETNEQD